MTRSYGKRNNQTKTFLEEASALIELVNLVDRYRLKQKKLYKCSHECNGKKNESRRHQEEATREHRKPSGNGRTEALRKSLKVTVQCKSKKHHRSGKKNNPKVIRYPAKSDQLFHSSDKQPKKTHKHRIKGQSAHAKSIKNLQPKMYNNFEDLEAKLYTSKLNANTPIADKELQRQLFFDLDKMNYVRIYSLKDVFRLSDKTLRGGFLGGTPVLFPKTSDPKFDLNDNIPDILLTNKKSQSHNTKKRVKEERDSAKYEKEEKQSIHLTLNMRIKTDSRNIKLKVKTKKKSSTSCKHEPNDLDFDVPNNYYSTTPQEQLNRLLMNILTRKVSKSSCDELSQHPLVKKINDKEFMKQQERVVNPNFRDVPSTKPQAVYNVYDISTPQFPTPQGGVMRVFKSNLQCNLNFCKGPKTEQTISTSEPYTPSGKSEGKEIRYKSKVGYNSGTTSLQQSFSVGRKPQPEEYEYVSEPSLPCDCEPFECDPSIDSDQTQTSTCPTCCQYEEPPYVPPPEKVTYITTLKRAKRRIMNRVANVRDDASEIVTSPCTFFKNFYYNRVNKLKIEPAQKDVGSCTCKPFVETDKVSVIERNVRPDCSFLQRLFGDLLFNDKCVVCTKQTEIRKKSKFACGPDICIEATGILTCVSKWFDKCKKKMPKKKKKKEEKDSPICKFICKMFCGHTDEDRKKLLKQKAKIRKRKEQEAKKQANQGGPGGPSTGKRVKYPGRRHFRRATKRIRDKYYRNKKMAEQQKGRYSCDFYLMSLRNKPCLWVYYMCPFCYPHCLQALSVWKQVSDIMLFFIAIVVWSPCILFAECLKVCACNMFL